MLFSKKQQISDRLLGSPADSGGQQSLAKDKYIASRDNPRAQRSEVNGTMQFDGGQSEIEKQKIAPVDFINDDFCNLPMFQEGMEELETNQRYLIVSEPKSFFGRLQAIFQNMFEVLIVLVVISLATVHPSYISLLFVMVSYSALVPSTMNCERRVFWGLIMSIMNASLLCGTVFMKMRSAPQAKVIDGWNDGKETEAEKESKRGYHQWGYKIGKDAATGKITLDMQASLYFEVGAFLTYIVAIIFFLKMMMTQSFLKKNKTVSFILYHYNIIRTTEQQMKEEMDSDEDVKVSIGTKNQGDKETKERRKLEKEFKRKYKRQMDKILQKMPRCYLDCFYFSKLNKSFFLLTFLTQMFQSMGYNCLFEVPQLFMMLAFCSFYAFRKKAFIAFSYYILFFMSYCAFCVFIKLNYQVLMHSEQYLEWYLANSDSKKVKVLSAVFGQRVTKESQAISLATMQESDFDQTVSTVSIVCCFIFSHSWLIAKWSTVREQTNFFEKGVGWLKRWRFAHQFKDDVYTKKQAAEQVIKNLRTQIKKKKEKKEGGDEKSASINKSIKDLKAKMKKNGFLQTIKSDFNFYMPSITIWLLRFGLGFQAYMYHTKIGLFQLAYVLLTCFFSSKFTYFMSMCLILPLYSFEFLIIYVLGIPGLAETLTKSKLIHQLDRLQPVTRAEMVKNGSPMMEQVLYFFNLAMLFLTISCFHIMYIEQNKARIVDREKKREERQEEAKMRQLMTEGSSLNTSRDQMYNPQSEIELQSEIQEAQDNKEHLENISKNASADGPDPMVRYITRKMKLQKTGSIWKVSFYVLRYIHVIMLAILYYLGSEDLNHFRPLGFMMMFSFWTMSENLYRKTVKFMIFFISYFILGQYYFSLTYQQYENDAEQLYRLHFLNMYDERLNKWKKDDPVYFRFKPYVYDWLILILTCLLCSINQIYLNKREVDQIEAFTFKQLEEKHRNLVYFVMNAFNKLKALLIIICFGVIFYFIGKVQTNFINIMFYSVTICTLMILAKNDNKPSTNKWALFCARIMLSYSIVVIIVEFNFACTFGMKESDIKTSFDQQFKKDNQWTYHMFQIIGFRMVEEKDKMPIAYDTYKDYFKLKFTSYIVFLLVSKFWVNYLNEAERARDFKLKMSEKNWAKLLMYKFPLHQKQKIRQMKAQQDRNSSFQGLNDSLNESLIQDQNLASSKEIGTFQRSITKQQKEMLDQMQDDYLLQNDERKDIGHLMRQWIKIQTDPAYKAYIWLDWWPFFDTIATYSHLFTNFILIYVAISIKITLYSFFLIISICLFYLRVSMKINENSMEVYKESGLLEQTELKIAGLVSKKFRMKTTRQFMQLRQKFWKLQTTIYVILACLGFSTTLVYRYRDLLHTDWLNADDSKPEIKEQLFNDIKQVDKWQFYLFMIGIYKDHRKEQQNYYYIPYMLIAFSFVLESFAINWLENRNGCNYNVFQKIIEMEERVKAIQALKQAPQYNPSRYKNHYFYPDFDSLRDRMTEETKDKVKYTKKAKYDLSENRDFIPYKVATRIKHAIVFTVRLDCRSDELTSTGQGLDKQTMQMLEEYDKFCKGHAHFVPFDDFTHDYESFPVLRNHKVRLLEHMLKGFIDRKYKISFMKGMMFLMEQLILLLTTITMLLKANVFSFIYLIFILKYFRSATKVYLLVRMGFYISLLLVLQYAFFLFNLTSATSPQPYPLLLEHYPHMYYEEDETKIPYLIPFFYKFKSFRDLKLSYFLGIGISAHQINCLYLDFLNLALISMYVFNFRNPVLFRSMKKVFWSYPSEFDTVEKWKRLLPNVVKQHKWFQKPKDLHESPKYKRILEAIGNAEKGVIDDIEVDRELIRKQIKFAQDYHNMHFVDEAKEEDKENHFNIDHIEQAETKIIHQHAHNTKSFNDYGDSDDEGEKEKEEDKDKEDGKQHGDHNYDTAYDKGDLNYMLINWLELKYDKVWSTDLIKEKKWELKDQSFYFRAVKQGSVLVYLTYHVFLIFVIFLMATLRRSLISFVYIIILLPRMKDGAEVLNQRDINQDKLKNQAKAKLEALKHTLAALEEKKEKNRGNVSEETQTLADIAQVKLQIKEVQAEVMKFEKRKSKTKQQKLEDRGKESSDQWKMLSVVRDQLLKFATFDLCMQVMLQMPFMIPNKFEEEIGIRKIWREPSDPQRFTFSHAINKGNSNLFNGFRFDASVFHIQIIISLTICLISLQCEIFQSEGYQKYVTQTDGSMDLIMNLAELKQKSLTYIYNNFKIQKILRNQQKREIIIQTVQKVKEKLIRWRKFQRSTLDTMEGKSAAAPPPSSDQGPKVQFDQQEEVHEAVKGDNDDEEETNDNQLVHMVEMEKKKSIPPEVANELFDKMAIEFVKEKEKKLSRCARCYLCLQRKYVTQILFKNQKGELTEIVSDQAKGKKEAMSVNCELEKVMLVETKEMIRNKYDNINGVTELWKLLNSTRGKSGKSILQLTQLDEKIKLNQMPNTWRFTRFGSLSQKYLETFFYMLISNTENIIYLSMMGSMYQSAGIISIIYPILIFGFALLEETRPRHTFWTHVRNYSMVMLGVKFSFNLKVFDFMTESEQFQYWNGFFQIGLRKQNTDLLSILYYLLPEIMIITFIMLNQIQLKLIGLYTQIEEDIEGIKDGMKRFIYQGDTEKVQEDKKQRTYMNMQANFKSYDDQWQVEKQMLLEKEHEKKALERNRFDGGIMEDSTNSGTNSSDHDDEITKAEQHQQVLQGLSEQIILGSTQYDIDESGDIESELDVLVKRRLIQKGLENDSLYFVEGGALNNNPDFINEYRFDLELKQKLFEEKPLSSGEFQQEMEQVQELLDSKQKQEQRGIFERSDYLKRVFPSLMEQKPGEDFYGTATCLLMVIVIFIINNVDNFFVTPEELLKGAEGSNNIFSSKLSVLLLLCSCVLVLERYISRADVRVKVKQSGLELEDKSFFNKQQMFARSQTARSMTVKLQTMKTTDLDMTSADSTNFLAQISEQQQEQSGPQQNKTKVSKQQKCKYGLHLTILVISHLFIFFYIPFVGNVELYGAKQGPLCDDNKKEMFKYGCRNFHSKWQLIAFYTLVCYYLYISAKQLRHGLPTFKIASSVLSGHEWYTGIMIIVYVSIPFAMELRCLLDFAFTKTSLDIFQYWQMFNYHIEMYQAKVGNFSYEDRVFGTRIHWLDEVIGIAILIGLLLLLIGPIYFFSEYAFIQPNPVIEAEISVALVVSKNLKMDDLRNRSVWKWELEQKKKKERLKGIVHENRNSMDPITQEQFEEALQTDTLHLYDMAYHNSYISHPDDDDEIDMDLLFGRLSKEEEFERRRSRSQRNETKAKQNTGFKDEINFAEEEEKKKGNGFQTRVPFLLYKVADPNMRTIDQKYLDEMPYSNWTETKFFKPEQIQEVIATEYPDQAWTIDYYNREFLMEDINSTFSKTLAGMEGFELSLVIETKFLRENPSTAKTATGYQRRILDLTREEDCQTMQQLQAFTSIDCQRNEYAFAQILFQQAYQPNLILGATDKVYNITRKVSYDGETNPELIKKNQMYDIMLEYRCPNIWIVRGSFHKTQVFSEQLPFMKVDPKQNCKPAVEIPANRTVQVGDGKTVKLNKSTNQKTMMSKLFTRFNFTLFSMMVSGSFLAGYSVKTFYVTMAYGLSGTVRAAFIFGTWKGFLYEITDPTAVIRVIEACYMYRFEQDFYKEEESYRMVQEIVRTPDLLKALTGSTLKGSLDPILDKIKDEKDRQKYRHLERLEAKNKFDVSKMKEDLKRKYIDN